MSDTARAGDLPLASAVGAALHGERGEAQAARTRVLRQSRPRRVQLQRRRGWRKPEGAVVVAPPSRWGNPHVVTWHASRWWEVSDGSGHRLAWEKPNALALARELFRIDLYNNLLDFSPEDVRAQLAGRDLCCWCPLDWPCHADVLLAVANSANSSSASSRPVPVSEDNPRQEEAP